MAASADAPRTPEGRLLRSVRVYRGISMRAAARTIGISEAWWRGVENGYQVVAGHRTDVTARPDTLAKMARALDITPQQLRDVGRDDAADLLAGLLELEELEPNTEVTLDLPALYAIADNERLPQFLRDQARHLIPLVESVLASAKEYEGGRNAS